MDTIIFGLISGSIILLSSVGFAMIVKVEGFLNIAHGQMLLFGAYLGLFFAGFDLPLSVTILLASIATGVLGMICYGMLFRPVKSQGMLVLLFTSVGAAYVIHGVVGAIAGKRMLAYDLPPTRAIRVFGQPFMTKYELITVVLALVLALAVHLFMAHSRSGKEIRAVADNEDLARARGIDPVRSSYLVWFVASALGGLAGVLMGIMGSLHLAMGWQQIIIILATTVLGGVGSIYGVMLGAFVLAFGIEIGLLFAEPSYRSAIAFLIIILVLFVRPQGLQSLWGAGKLRTH